AASPHAVAGVAERHQGLTSAREQTAYRVPSLVQLHILFLERLFETLPLRDIPDGSRYQQPIFRSKRTQTYLDRKLTAVLSQAVQSHAGAHRPDPRLLEKTGSVSRVITSEPSRQEDLDRFAENLTSVV